MKNFWCWFVVSCFLPLGGRVEAKEIWPRPVIVPRPDHTAGVEQPVVSLNGTWKFTVDPSEDFWQNGVDPSGWSAATMGRRTS